MSPFKFLIFKLSLLLPVIKNSFWLLLEKAIRAFLGMFVGAWVASYLGPSEFGELAFSFAIVSFLQGIAYLGMDAIIVREISHDDKKSGIIIGTAFALRILVGLIIWITMITIMAIIYGPDSRVVLITGLVGMIVVFQATDTIDLWFQSKTQSHRTVKVKIVAHVFANGLKLVCIKLNFTVIAFALISSFDALLTSLGLYIAYKNFKTPQKWKFCYGTGRNLLIEAWPYILGVISVSIYMKIDQFMIKNMLGSKELGIYAAALPISQVWYVIPMSLTISLAPIITRHKAISEEKYYESLTLIFRLYILIAVLISALVSLNSKQIILLLYGVEYISAASVLNIHVISNIFIYQTLAQGLWNINEKRGIITTYQTLLGAFTSLAANYYLIPIFGLNGAALSALISYAVSGVLSNLYFAPNIFKMQFGFRANLSKKI
jgi:PST family polysaccharide transporter